MCECSVRILCMLETFKSSMFAGTFRVCTQTVNCLHSAVTHNSQFESQTVETWHSTEQYVAKVVFNSYDHSISYPFYRLHPTTSVSIGYGFICFNFAVALTTELSPLSYSLSSTNFIAVHVEKMSFCIP